MLFNNKKGISTTFIAAIVIVLVSFFVVGGVARIIISRIPQKSADQVCKLSVAKRAATKSKVKDPFFGAPVSEKTIVPLICKTQEFTIDAKGKSDKEVIRELLNYAARAWNVWGEGRYGGGLFDSFLGVGGNGCYRYYNIKIKNLDYPIPRRRIRTFMLDENNIYPKTNTTYWDYLVENTEYSNFIIDEDKIKDRHIYSIVFADFKAKKSGTFKKIHINSIYISDLEKGKIKLGKAGAFGFNFKDVECTIISGTGGK